MGDEFHLDGRKRRKPIGNAGDRQSAIDDYLLFLERGDPGFFLQTGAIQFDHLDKDLLSRSALCADDFFEATNGDQAAITRICRAFLISLKMERQFREDGETHNAIRKRVLPHALIDQFICDMISSASMAKKPSISNVLLGLVFFRLLPGQRSLQRQWDRQSRPIEAADIAGTMIIQGKRPSFRKVARQMGVHPSTVLRWFGTPDEFHAQAAANAAYKRAN
jgi:hypothetical protein